MKKRITVSGMSCEHCVNAVKKALEEIPGVASADVSLDPGSAKVTLSDASLPVEKLTHAIEEAGYQAVIEA